MIVWSEIGPCPSPFNAERLTLILVDGGQRKLAASTEHFNILPSFAGQANVCILPLEYKLYSTAELDIPSDTLMNGCSLDKV